MLEVTPLGWALTIGAVAALLIVDLAVAGRRPHAVGFREAAAQSVFFIAVAVAFGLVLGLVAGWDFGAQYFAGYVVEKSLSVDNLFVFVIIMSTFAVPAEHQQKVLTIGILLALILRAIFIALGAALLDAIPEIRTSVSLAVIVAIPAVTTFASILKVRRDPAARAHAGSLRRHP